MTFDNIIANPPYSKIGRDITKHVLEEIPYNDISMLGTRAMFRKHNDVLDIEYVYIKDYVLNPLSKVKWAEQVILLGHKGQCKVIPSRGLRGLVSGQPNEIRVPFPQEYSGDIHISLNCLLTRSIKTSIILPLSDGDYEYIKTYWNDMTRVERFWWLYDKGLYCRYVPTPFDNCSTKYTK